MAKSSTTAASHSSTVHPDATRELSQWVQSLPPDIKLRLDCTGNIPLDRDVYQLHLPYLTAVIILHLRKSASDLPQALPPAILAASCTAKILRAILARGNARFLMAITCWYCGTAFIALLQGSRIAQFAKEAEDGMVILTSMIEQLQKMWPSANVIRQGFDRMKRNVPVDGGTALLSDQGRNHRQWDPPPGEEAGNCHSSNDPCTGQELDWTNLLPFATSSTDKIAECLLRNKKSGDATRGMPSPANTFFYENVMNEYHDFLDPLLCDTQADFSEFSLFQV